MTSPASLHADKIFAYEVTDMPKLGTPIMAAVLAVAGFATAANAITPDQSYGSYYINSGSPAAIAAPIVQTRSVVVPAPSMVAASTGLTMDQCVLKLYSGPRLENTLTMPDACTFLRP